MPKVKAKRTRGDSDDDYEASATQSTQSATQYDRQLASLSEDVKQAKISDLVQFFLIQDQKKIPIKKPDITKHVLKEHSKLFSLFMKEAEKRLAEVFGIKVVEVEKQKQKSYILVSALENDTNDPHQVWSDEDNSKLGLIMVILGMIFMNGNVIADQVLYHALRKLGVDIDRSHEVFGDVKKLLTAEFVRQGWLEYQRQPTSEPPTYEYSWGPRANAETSKRNILNFVCQVYGNNAEDWVSQFQDVQRSEPATGPAMEVDN